MTIKLERDADMPDAELRSTPPLDQHDEPMQAGRRYLIENDRKLCFDCPESGTLLYQSITRLGVVKEKNGVPVPAVPVLQMPPGDYVVHRMEDEV